MKVLLVYPKYPDTFWSFKHALKFISKKASLPPLGLLTVAAILPTEWEKKLIDMNVKPLLDEDILGADYVFVSAMSIQGVSARAVIDRCRNLGVRTVGGGPLFTAGPEEFEDVDHLVLNEAEITLPVFLEDLKNGRAEHLYTSAAWADVTKTPAPLMELVDLKPYASMNIQYSRGCPFDCEFCNITVLYGRKPRTKEKEQILGELEGLYAKGWRGGVFFVDDNFIGNRSKLKKEVLPAIIGWMEKHSYPFVLSTEVSINLSDDEELMSLMVRAGFITVFVGIESPNEESLVECQKVQNKNRDLKACVKKIQQFGLEVQAGFIVGFDNDPATIFERLIGFIQESGIVTAMVGLLNAPQGTKLYHRLQQEGRLLKAASGDNTDFSMNFIPRMNPETLINGYRKITQTIYSPRHYYARVKEFLKDYRRPVQTKLMHIRSSHVKAAFKSVFFLGVLGKERFYYWRLFFWSLFTRPRLFPLAITFTIYGFHFRKIFENHYQLIEKKSFA
ncbi:MAG: B12-binding domain-containing radical SAM protein [Candidatus Sulfobium sp.]